MLKHTEITLRRAEQFLTRSLQPLVLSEPVALETRFLPVEGRRSEKQVRASKEWQSIQPGFAWGPAYSYGWYRVQGTIPEEFDGLEVGIVYGEAKLSFERHDMLEATFFRDGVPVGGLDHGHHLFRVSQNASAGEKLDWCAWSYAHNAETTIVGKEKPRTPKPEVFRGFFLVAFDPEIAQLALDFQFCLDMLKNVVPTTDPAHATILRALNDVINGWDPGKPKAVSKARKTIKDALGSIGSELNHTITPVGHAHLDTAWLWPLETTHFKMAHTTAVQLELLERYPEHIFVHSQASQYEWLEKEFPALFEKVVDAIRAKRWEVVGSMWVEADCNLTGAESLVRQFLYGRRYFEKKLGAKTDDMWLPDVFGYSAALPQILAKFGIKYFLTQKLSWSQFNKFPHHTFWWQGIDGTRVWTHFPPADTYNGSGFPSELASSVAKYRDHGRCDRSLLPVGHGDGGGGPSEIHLEMLRRARLAPCLPVVESGQRAIEFFQQAFAESHDLLTWVGELYLEFHRGTYTSQAANKKGNRESEFLMRDVELLACFRDDFPHGYPQEEIERIWKLILLNQFHDIIPGSSVREVYIDSDRDYAEIRRSANALIDQSLDMIGGKMKTEGMSRPIALFHNARIGSQGSIPWESDEAPGSLRVGEEQLPVQVVEFAGEKQLIFATPADALGAVAVGDLSDQPATSDAKLKIASRRMENENFVVRFDQNGAITSIQTVEDQPIEYIEPGKLGNLFQLLDDQPLMWSAWDVDAYSFETARNLTRSESFEVVEKGPVRVAVELVKKFGNSTIRQRISLGPTPGIRFDTWVDWREENKMLKVAFPLRVNSPRASYEIQFGHVERPTHKNTSWDMARFEVCAQKWADISEGGHGAALINDGKYGYDANGNVLRLSLLRSPKAPDPLCDMGEHRFTYVLLPHYRQIEDGEVVAAAYALNAPVRAKLFETGGELEGSIPRFVTCDDASVVIESVKKAEDGDAIVVRLYECHNTRGRTELLCARNVRRAWLANLDEKPLTELEIQDDSVKFEFRPFEILTILLEV